VELQSSPDFYTYIAASRPLENEFSAQNVETPDAGLSADMRAQKKLRADRDDQPPI
jgi:hypothetical protein